MIERILVPVDFSDPSLQALEYAVELGGRLKAELVVLHVVEREYFPFAGELYGSRADARAVHRALEAAARQRLAHLAAQLRQRRIAARPLLVVGTADRAIVGTARKVKADLIVMATHGRSTLSHVLLGRVAEKVLRASTCPVLSVSDVAADGHAARPARRARRVAAPARRQRPRGA